MERLLCVLIGYVFGLFQTGYLYGKLNHIDIRNYGSGNSGTTNALRTLGKKAGIITFLGDCFKCVLAVVVVKAIFVTSHPDTITLLGMYAGVGAVLGHNYPFYMKFKGGKGIAATGGLMLATNFWMAVISLSIFLVVVALTRYVSVGSLVVVIVFVIEVVTYGMRGGFGLSQPYLYEMYALAVLLAVSAFYKHKANIKRLMNGTENKLNLKK
jgi:glycerol-3-phosphate acyltransferase PlsY